MPRRRLALVLSALLVAVSAACGSAAAEDSIVYKAEETGQLTIGIRYTQPGMSERTLDGRYVGFDVDVARFIADKLGVDEEGITWRDVVAADRELELATGKVDMMLSTYSITPKRKQRVRFAGPYFITGQSVMVRLSTTDITGPESLDGKKLCSVAGTTSAAEVKRRFSKRVKLVEYPRDPDCVTALLAGLVDAVSTDEAILAGYVAQNPELLKIVGDQFNPEHYGVGLPPEDEDAQDAVNAALQEMMDSGAWQRSVRRHLGRSGIKLPEPPTITER